jgi:hypothetical protein
MKGKEDLSEVVRYLVDVQDEYSPARFRLYMSSVRVHMPEAAYADLEAAFEEITLASQCVDRAVERMQSIAKEARCNRLTKLSLATQDPSHQ